MAEQNFKVPSLSLIRKKHPSTSPHEEQTDKRPPFPAQGSSREVSEQDNAPSDDVITLSRDGSDVETVSQDPSLPYTEPRWSGVPSEEFSLTVIKNGIVIREISINKKPFHVFGRLPGCDVVLDHPSVSRYHAVLQCRPTSDGKDTQDTTLFSTNPTEAGLYVYDLGSTHGTFLNKSRVQPRCYYRMRVGQMVRLGGSSRLFVLEHAVSGEASQEEVEKEAEEERRAIELHKSQWEELQAKAREEQERERQRMEEAGASWGMLMDDQPSSTETLEEMDIEPEREAYYIEDPKKALKKFFDREGLEFEYETEEEGPLHARIYTVKVRLPIDMATGEPVYAEASVKGRKKDAVVQCALNACRLLDAQDMLRNPIHRHKRHVRNWEENDYYDSDEDIFLDRTGDIEKKRKHRMERAGKLEDSAKSYQSLQSTLAEIQHEIHSLEEKLAHATKAESLEGDVDSLDTFMRTVGFHLDKGKKSEIKHHLHELRKEEEKILKLIGIAKPTELPSLSSPTQFTESPHGKHSAKHTSPAGHLKSTHSSSIDAHSLKTSPGSATGCETTHANKDTSSDQRVDAPAFSPPAKRSRRMGPSLPSHLKAKSKSGSRQRDTHKDKDQWREDPDYASWLPPSDQTGDGRTTLNERYGY